MPEIDKMATRIHRARKARKPCRGTDAARERTSPAAMRLGLKVTNPAAKVDKNPAAAAVRATLSIFMVHLPISWWHFGICYS